MKLTVAMHSVGREARGEARDLASSGRPQLMRHPLGALKSLPVAILIATAMSLLGEPQPGGSVSGLVVDDRGTPLAGATVSLKAGKRLVEAIVSSREGEYEFRNVSPGSYHVSAQLPGFASPGPQDRRISEGGTVRLDVIVLKAHPVGLVIGARDLQVIQVAVIRELMKEARKDPPYYALCVMVGTELATPSAALMKAVADTTAVPLRPYSGLTPASVESFGNPKAVQLFVNAAPDAEAGKLVFLRGAVGDYGQTRTIRFRLASRQGHWTVVEAVLVGKVDSGPL